MHCMSRVASQLCRIPSEEARVGALPPTCRSPQAIGLAALYLGVLAVEDVVHLDVLQAKARSAQLKMAGITRHRTHAIKPITTAFTLE